MPETRSHLQTNPEHKLIVTGKKGNGDVLRVRCKCMAEYRNVSDHYYNYDHLGEVRSITEAIKLYEAHVAAKGG